MADDVKPGADNNGESLWSRGKKLFGEIRKDVKDSTGFDAANLLANPLGVGLLAIDKAVSDSRGAKPAASAASGVRIPGMTPQQATDAMVQKGNEKLQELGARVGDAAGAVATGLGQAAASVGTTLGNAIGVATGDRVIVDVNGEKVTMPKATRSDMDGTVAPESSSPLSTPTRAAALNGDSGAGTVTVAPGGGSVAAMQTPAAKTSALAAPKLSARDQALQEVQKFGDSLKAHMKGKSQASILKAAFDEVRRDYEVRKLRNLATPEDDAKLKALEEIAQDKKGMAATLATPVAAPAPAQ